MRRSHFATDFAKGERERDAKADRVATYGECFISMTYVRNAQAGQTPVDPTRTGDLEILSDFGFKPGTARVPQACEGMYLTVTIQGV